MLVFHMLRIFHTSFFAQHFAKYVLHIRNSQITSTTVMPQKAKANIGRSSMFTPYTTTVVRPHLCPHRSTTYVDAAYSYRPSSVVCPSVTLVSPAKTAAPIELPFGLRTWVGPGKHVLDGSPDPPWGKFLGENGRPIVKYRDTLRSSVQRRLTR